MTGVLIKISCEDAQGRSHVVVEAESRVSWPRTWECLQPPKAGRGRGRGPLEPLEGDGPAHIWLSDVWPSELGENPFLFFESPFVVLCYGSPGTLTWVGTGTRTVLFCLTPPPPSHRKIWATSEMWGTDQGAKYPGKTRFPSCRGDQKTTVSLAVDGPKAVTPTRPFLYLADLILLHPGGLQLSGNRGLHN